MSRSNLINLSSDSSFFDSVWDDFVVNNPSRVEKEEYEEVSSRKRPHMSMIVTSSFAGPSNLQAVPQDALTKGDSSISSYISPYENTDDETSTRALSVPPLAAILPPEELQAPCARALIAAPPSAGPSSSFPPVREVVRGLACPRVYDWINMRGAPKVMPSLGFPKEP